MKTFAFVLLLMATTASAGIIKFEKYDRAKKPEGCKGARFYSRGKPIIQGRADSTLGTYYNPKTKTLYYNKDLDLTGYTPFLLMIDGEGGGCVLRQPLSVLRVRRLQLRQQRIPQVGAAEKLDFKERRYRRCSRLYTMKKFIFSLVALFACTIADADTSFYTIGHGTYSEFGPARAFLTQSKGDMTGASWCIASGVADLEFKALILYPKIGGTTYPTMTDLSVADSLYIYIESTVSSTPPQTGYYQYYYAGGCYAAPAPYNTQTFVYNTSLYPIITFTTGEPYPTTLSTGSNTPLPGPGAPCSSLSLGSTGSGATPCAATVTSSGVVNTFESTFNSTNLSIPSGYSPTNGDSIQLMWNQATDGSTDYVFQTGTITSGSWVPD